MTQPAPSESTVVMNAEAMAAAMRRIAQEIVAANPRGEPLVLLGILRRGKPLADRLADLIGSMTGVRPKVGALATTLYRDDLRSGRGPAITGSGVTHFDFNVDDATVVLVDDVIAAGRTVRAALDEVMDYGRPRRVQLACLVDRGLRELPIQPDYLGCSIATDFPDHVAVLLVETDGEDAVLLERGAAQDSERGVE
jgi:pyrimidine operon attenuation protein / uracil phosphoribosyltransferase